MPFIGRDWRSPGETWVKTDEGWERKKLLERLRRDAQRQSMELENNINNNVNNAESKDADEGDESWQPFCPITLKCTREIAGFNGLSEAFKRLDFRNAVRDIRRFNYICKLLHLLITNNLTMLSGCAQKVLFTMLEEVAFQVSTNQTNIHILQKLLGDLQKTLIEYYCWGRPLGSTQLWDHHRRTIGRINSMAQCIVIKQPSDTIIPKFQHLPEELVREVLLRLSDHTDLQNGAKAYSVMQQLLDEQHIWRELCRFHFTSQQIRHILSSSRRNSLTSLGGTGQRGAVGAGTSIPMPRLVTVGGQSANQNAHPPDANSLQQASSTCCGDDTNCGIELPENDNALFKLENVDWQDTYHRLRRMFGLREEYAEILQLCRHCRCLFWKSFGHPCIADDSNETADLPDKSALYVPITPQAFLKFFSL